MDLPKHREAQARQSDGGGRFTIECECGEDLYPGDGYVCQCGRRYTATITLTWEPVQWIIDQNNEERLQKLLDMQREHAPASGDGGEW